MKLDGGQVMRTAVGGLLVAVIVFCGAGCAAREGQAGWARFEKSGIAISYPTSAFSAVKMEKRRKIVDMPDAMPVGVGPERWELYPIPVKIRQILPGRYYFPSGSVIYITPLQDGSVSDFSKAYGELSANATALKKLLDGVSNFEPWLDAYNSRRIPVGMPDLPSEPFNNAARMMLAKFRRLEFPNLRGFRLLTYYANGITGYGATNAELTYDFQGVTRDGRYYVSARIGVRHPLLPESMDDPRAKSEGTEKESIEEHRRVNSWRDDSFSPALEVLDEMMRSLEVGRR